MKDPHREIRDYLEALILKVLHIRSLHDQLGLMMDWDTPSRRVAFKPGRYFFRLVRYTFSRTILTELCKILSKREQRSVWDFLDQAKVHAKSIRPTRWTPDYTLDAGGSRQQISVKEYRDIVSKQLAALGKHADVITRIEGRRDEELVHSDPKYFTEPKLIYKRYPLNDIDIGNLLDTVSEVLRIQNVYLNESDIQMRVTSGREVDTVLSFVRGFSRVWSDRRLIEAGIWPVEYKKDDYSPVISNRPETRTSMLNRIKARLARVWRHLRRVF